ncbi:MAG TPA: hypothetical protein VFG12_14940 [Rhodopila sp.]|jgi:acyl-CoA thioesterase-1|nr:hypothetical protein [Rhodopila sp.]
MDRRALACLLVWLVTVTPAWAEAGGGLACDMPAELTTPSAPLNWAAAALAKKGELDVLALGSGSTVGQTGGLGNPALSYKISERSFPYRMVESLRTMRPKLRFNLTVQGGRNMTADMMLPILQQELATHRYDLVLWQTGTVEAVHGLRPDIMRGVLLEGAEAAAAAHADLVLVDPQFSRFLRANADLGPYETVLEQITDTQSATLFRRFDLTETWVSNGQIDLERVGREQRDSTIGLLNDCLGEALARFVLAGTTEH